MVMIMSRRPEHDGHTMNQNGPSGIFRAPSNEGKFTASLTSLHDGSAITKKSSSGGDESPITRAATSDSLGRPAQSHSRPHSPDKSSGYSEPDSGGQDHNYWPADAEEDSADELSIRNRKKTNKFIRGIRQTLSDLSLARTGGKSKLSSLYMEGVLLNNAKERIRNDQQHRAIVDLWDDRLHLSPVRSPAKVLDVGTASGIWALEFGKEHPESQVVGVDLEAVTPPYNVSNCTFEMVDVTKPWKVDTKFDFIHVRMLGAFSRSARASAFQHMCDHLSPGGWIEFTEWSMRLQSPDHSTDDSKLHEWFRVYDKGLNVLGFPTNFAEEWRKAMQRKGFSGIAERRYSVPINTWPPSKRLKKIGLIMSSNAHTWVETITTPVLGGGLNWPSEKVERLVGECYKEIPDPKYHSFVNLITVYGQKPLDK